MGEERFHSGGESRLASTGPALGCQATSFHRRFLEMPSSKKLLNIAESPQKGETQVDDDGDGAETSTEAAAPTGPEIREIIVRQGSGWQTTALLFLSLLLLTTVAVAFYAFHRVAQLNDEMGTTMRRVEQKIQNLDAGISFDSKRQQLMLGIRDEIM